jgi:hypothetical protein
MANDDRWALRWCEHSTCGRLSDRNSANDDTLVQSGGGGGIWGKTASTGGTCLSVMAAW